MSESYATYLRSDHWQRVRAGALWIADYRCQLCGAKEGLEVHHRDYERKGHERPEDVVVLCGACHGRFHGKTGATSPTASRGISTLERGFLAMCMAHVEECQPSLAWLKQTAPADVWQQQASHDFKLLFGYLALGCAHPVPASCPDDSVKELWSDKTRRGLLDDLVLRAQRGGARPQLELEWGRLLVLRSWLARPGALEDETYDELDGQIQTELRRLVAARHPEWWPSAGHADSTVAA